MKNGNRWLRGLFAFLCGGGLALGNVFCLITAHGLRAESRHVAAACLAAAAVGALIFSLKKPWGWALALFGGALLLEALRWRAVYGGALDVAKTMLRHCGTDFPWMAEAAQGIYVPVRASGTAFLALLGSALAVLTAASLCRRWTLLPVALLSGGSLALCFIMLYPMPAGWAVTLLATAYALMALTHAARRRQSAGAERWALALVIPMAAACILLLYCVHPGTYTYPQWSVRLEERLSQWTDRLPDLWDRALGRLTEPGDGRQGIVRFSPKDSLDRADLNRMNGGGRDDGPVMTVRSTQEGLLYLRGYAYRHYTGRSWLGKTAEDEEAPGGELFWGRGGFDELLEIKTHGEHSLIYLPYGAAIPQGGQPVEDLYVENAAGATDYRLAYSGWSGSADAPHWSHNFSSVEKAYYVYLLKYYQDPGLSEEARKWLDPILEELRTQVPVTFRQTDSYRIWSRHLLAQVAADYVKESAAYDLHTPRMPAGEKDFVTWFLRDSESGFCVHYATATTVLLRALGIPARYVSGYVVYAKENTWTEVSGKNAHAWVEYCAGDGRWTLLEPTPETEARASGLSVYLDEGRIERLPQKSEDPDEEDDPDDRTEDEREEQPRQEPEQEDTPGMTETGGRARRSRTWLKALLWAAAGLAAWQAMLRLIRRQTLKRGDPNRRAVAYWRHIRRLARLSGSPVSEEIEQLALKARFSQHEISQEELRFLEERAAALREWLLAGNLVKKIALRLLWGL